MLDVEKKWMWVRGWERERDKQKVVEHILT
jgi:hypothetical protein